MIGHAYQRVTLKLDMPGLIVVHEDLSIGNAIEQIVMVAACSTEAELQGRVIFLPL